MPVTAQQHAHLVFGLGQFLLRARLDEHADAVVAAVRLEVALDRNHHEIVLRISEDAAQRFGRAHYFIRDAFDLDELADRVAPFEKARAQIVAQEYDRGMAGDLLIGDSAPDIHLHVINGRDIFGDTLDIDAQDAVALEGDPRVARRHHADVLNQRGALLDELIFVRPELRIALLHLHELLRVPRAEPRHAHHAETVGTHVGDLLGDVQIHTVNQGGYGDQRGGGQNDAEQRQETAQLVLAQRIEGDPGGLPERRRKAKFAGFRHCLQGKTRSRRDCSGKNGNFRAERSALQQLLLLPYPPHRSRHYRQAASFHQHLLAAHPLFLFLPPPPPRSRHYRQAASFHQHLLAVNRVRGLTLQIGIDQRAVNEHHPGGEVGRKVDLFPPAAAQPGAEVRRDHHHQQGVEGHRSKRVVEALAG